MTRSLRGCVVLAMLMVPAASYAQSGDSVTRINMRQENGVIEVLDKTNLRVDPAKVSDWFFFPTR